MIVETSLTYISWKIIIQLVTTTGCETFDPSWHDVDSDTFKCSTRSGFETSSWYFTWYLCQVIFEYLVFSIEFDWTNTVYNSSNVYSFIIIRTTKSYASELSLLKLKQFVSDQSLHQWKTNDLPNRSIRLILALLNRVQWWMEHRQYLHPNHKTTKDPYKGDPIHLAKLRLDNHHL